MYRISHGCGFCGLPRLGEPVLAFDFSPRCSHVSAGTTVVLEFDWAGYLRGLTHMAESCNWLSDGSSTEPINQGIYTWLPGLTTIW